MKYTILAGELYTPAGLKQESVIQVEDGKIAALGRQQDTDAEILDLSAYRVLPGLVDTHIHGAYGHDIMDATPEAIQEISTWLARQGVTAFLGATVTSGLDKTAAALKNVAACMEAGTPGARLLGAYLEGPYIGEKYKGAHPQEFIRSAIWDELQSLLQAADGTVKVVALAPEEAGAMIPFLRKAGIRVALGHSNATWEEAMEAVDNGASIAVHIFNGMRGLHHREPGIVGAMLTDDSVRAEVIADGIHLAPPVMEIVKRCKGKDGIILVSDCMRAGGLADGEYDLGELKVTVEQAIARVKGSDSLAGSTLRLVDAVKNMVERVNTPLTEAIAMATINPARAIGLDNELGSIEPGKRADLIAIDEDYNVALTMIDGKVVHDIRKG